MLSQSHIALFLCNTFTDRSSQPALTLDTPGVTYTGDTITMECTGENTGNPRAGDWGWFHNSEFHGSNTTTNSLPVTLTDISQDGDYSCEVYNQAWDRWLVSDRSLDTLLFVNGKQRNGFVEESVIV